jgi:hypothetical protein
MIGRRLIAGTAVVAAVAAGGIVGALIGVPGLSGAATSPSSTTTTKPDAAANEGPHRAFRGHIGPFIGGGKDVLEAGAKALDLSVDELLAKLRDGKTTIADVAKAQNVDVQTVIDAMTAAAKSDITDMVNNPLPVPPDFPDGLKGPGIAFGHFGGLKEDKLGAAAKALGITADELITDLRNGKSIADVAKAENIDVNTVIDAIVSDAQSSIDAAVKDGKLTQDEATKLKSDLKDRITDLVNNAGTFGERHFRGGDFGPGRWEPETQQG